MHATALQGWRDEIVFARDIETPGDRSDFFASARAGQYVQLFRGVHFSSVRWNEMNADERHRVIVKAAAAFAGRDLVFSHSSAAGLWQLPWIGMWPTKAHITVPNASGGRSKKMFARHTIGAPLDTVIIDGVTVTTLAKTVADIARTQSFACAVTVADAALRRTVHPIPGVPSTAVDRYALLRELDDVPIRQGVAKARKAVSFASGLADRPGESMSRVSMHLARLPAPKLQVCLVGASGRVWTVDFFWPHSNLIGEFDGEVKYTQPEFLRGRTSAQVVIDEKYREDDLRAADFGMARWGWKVAMSSTLLREQLVAAGLT